MTSRNSRRLGRKLPQSVREALTKIKASVNHGWAKAALRQDGKLKEHVAVNPYAEGVDSSARGASNREEKCAAHLWGLDAPCGLGCLDSLAWGQRKGAKFNHAKLGNWFLTGTLNLSQNGVTSVIPRKP